MGKYDECLDLLVEYFTLYLKNKKNSSDVIIKIEQLPQNKKIPALAQIESPRYGYALKHIGEKVELYVNGLEWEEHFFEKPDNYDDVIFYRKNNKMYVKKNENGKEIICEIRFKKFKEDNEFDERLDKNIIITVEEASNVLGTPAFGLDKNIIDKMYTEIKNCIDEDKSRYANIRYKNSKILEYNIIENIHNNFYNINNEMIKSIVENAHNPCDIADSENKTHTLYLYVHKDGYGVDSYPLQYSLTNDEQWFVSTHIDGPHFSYELHNKDRNKFVVIDLLSNNNYFYVTKNNNNVYELHNSRRDNTYYIDAFQLPAKLAYSLYYYESD